MPPLSLVNSPRPDTLPVFWGAADCAHKSLRIAAQLLQGLVSFWRTGIPDLATESPENLHKRARRLQRLSRALLSHFGVSLRASGKLPQRGLLVANHVSFVDIMVLSALQPTVFVSKAEVTRWPIVGPIAAAAGTIFIQRQKRSDVARANIHLHRAMDSGLLVTLFPEGTSSDGQSILPFQPSLLQPVLECTAGVTPAYLRYSGPDTNRVDEVAYFGDRNLQDCLWALVKRRDTVANVRFGDTLFPEGNRKSLALLLHAEVSQLAARFP